MLSATVFAVYWPVSNYPFLELDDNIYVTHNYFVRQGMTWEGLLDAFRLKSTMESNYYHPLTTLSHMLDVELFGLNSSAHHMVSVFFHLLNAVLLFLFLRFSTGATVRSGVVTFLFALHPLQVESVAWIAERKNLLSTAFWLLCCLAYVAYTRKTTVWRYILLFSLMLAGLLTKPMLVTLPCVFLLLDFWPLKRIRLQFPAYHLSTSANVTGGSMPTNHQPVHSILIEKIPLFLLSAAWVYLASLSAKKAGMLVSTDAVPYSLRIQNAVYSFTAYMEKLFFPFDLAVFYPFPTTDFPWWQIFVSFLIITVITIYALVRMQSSGYALVGWLWYIGTLMPVIGLKQQGLWPAMADRWAYVPMIGLLIWFVWGVHHVSQNRRQRTILLFLVLFCCVQLAVITRTQIFHWRDNISLSKHALEATQKNPVANHLYGLALMEAKNRTEGIRHIVKAIQIAPFYNTARISLGGIMAEEGRYQKAIENIRIAIQINPKSAFAYNNLGVTYKKMGKTADALKAFDRALQLNPHMADVYNNMANTLKQEKRYGEAIGYYQKALQIDPEKPELHNNLANAFTAVQNYDDAIRHYQAAIHLNPDQPIFYLNMADVQARKGNVSGAIQTLEAVRHHRPSDSTIVGYIERLKQLSKK